MTEVGKAVADALIRVFLEGLIATDEEEKKPENIPPQYRDSEDFEGGIHFWQLQQCIEELADQLRIHLDEDLDEVEARWKDHELFWGRYLSTGAIEYARRWNAAEEAGEDFEDGEFSMDWFGHVEDDPK